MTKNFRKLCICLLKHAEKRSWWALLSLIGVMTVEAAESNSLDLFVDTAKSHLWRTATSARPEIQWEVPEGTVSATLSVKSRYGVRIHDVSGKTALELNLETPESPSTENVYDLTLTFDFGTSNVVKHGQIGVVRGLGTSGIVGAAADIRENNADWAKYRGGSVVLQIPAGATQLMIDGTPVDVGLDGTAGWYGWNQISPKKGRAPYELALSVQDQEYSADVIVLTSGFYLIIK